MTVSSLVTAPVGTSLDEARVILNENKVEKLIILDDGGQLACWGTPVIRSPPYP